MCNPNVHPKHSEAGVRTSTGELRRDIDENLKRVYQATLDEAVPDRFKELLARLKAAEAGS